MEERDIAAPEPPVNDVDPLNPDLVISTTLQAKQWVRRARKAAPRRLTGGALADALGVSAATISQWESLRNHRLPPVQRFVEIAAACSVPPPKVTLQPPPRRDQEYYVPLPAGTLAQEILETGRVLASRTTSVELTERGARIFAARFGGQADTLQRVGDAHGLTRERVRQIIDRQLEKLRLATPRRERFDALVSACTDLPWMPVSQAEEQLRPILGEDLTLQAAQDYGIVVLGTKLPIEIDQRPGTEPMVGYQQAFPDWFDQAVSQAKGAVRHSGAAQFTLAWGRLVRERAEHIDPDEYRQAMEAAPGFEWIEEGSWFWFGPEHSNRYLNRAAQILAAAGETLDIEVIYNGIARDGRLRDSAIGVEAGVSPPMALVSRLLQRSPDLECRQMNNFRLKDSASARALQGELPQGILDALNARGGLATRGELLEDLGGIEKVNLVSIGVALASSPVLEQVEWGIYAIRGRRLDVDRLREARAKLAPSGFPKVEVERDGAQVSWIARLTAGSLRNGMCHLPCTARSAIGAGTYTCGQRAIVVGDHYVSGLIAVAKEIGVKEGEAFRICFDVDAGSVAIEQLATQTGDLQLPGD